MAYKITRRLLLRELFKSDGGVDIFVMHQQYRLPINEIILAVNDLQNDGLVTLNDLTIKPSKALRAWVFRNRYEIFFTQDELSWKETPHQFLIPRLSVDQIPSSEIGRKSE